MQITKMVHLHVIALQLVFINFYFQYYYLGKFRICFSSECIHI